MNPLMVSTPEQRQAIKEGIPKAIHVIFKRNLSMFGYVWIQDYTYRNNPEETVDYLSKIRKNFPEDTEYKIVTYVLSEEN